MLGRPYIRELAERATYLYGKAGRYWFSTQPTLNRLADERATALPDHEVDTAIADVLRREAATRAGFARVHSASDDPTSIDEATAMSLVILGPGYSHTGKGAVSSTVSIGTESWL